ncbi:MAG: cupin domain-containing protein [Nitrospiraceae bacterium]|nr:cupin domain-containing protein [Nitrospiraceae bacterium]
MKYFRLEETPESPVTHSPDIKKRVFTKEPVSCVRHLSHVVLGPGDSAFAHSHEDGFEVFYCANGEAVFSINGKDFPLHAGDCMVVEPGDVHEIMPVNGKAELFYFFAVKCP